MIYVVKHYEDEKLYPYGYTELKVGDIFISHGCDNIEYLNKYINELTGLYYIWKNVNDDVVGLCHYRRFLYDRNEGGILSWENAQYLANSYDIVVSEHTYVPCGIRESLLQQFPNSQSTVIKYIDFLVNLEPNLEYYYNTCIFNPTNLFIAKKDIIDNYCKWVFPLIVPAAERFKVEDSKKSNNELYQRIVGFLSERLLSYYIQKEKLNYKELQVQVI